MAWEPLAQAAPQEGTGDEIELWLQQPMRLLMNLLRSVPDLVIGTLFLVAVGLGPFAGVMAIALPTMHIFAVPVPSRPRGLTRIAEEDPVLDLVERRAREHLDRELGWRQMGRPSGMAPIDPGDGT